MSQSLATAPSPTAARADREFEPLPAALLCDIANGIAAADDLWRPHVRHDGEQRRPVRLLAADRWEAWVIGWTTGQHVELHDHGDSAGAFVVVDGALTDVARRAGVLIERPLLAGSITSVPPGAVHDVVAPGPAPATSIHIYSPPLTSMTFYDGEGRATRTITVGDEAPVADLRSPAFALHESADRG